MREAVRERDRQWHQLGRLVAREAEHHPRVAGAADVHALRDIGRLLVNAADDPASLGVKAVLRAGVPHIAHRLPDDAWNVDVAIRGDLPHHDHKAGGDDRLARDASQRIFGQDRVEDGVGDLVGQLVGMAFGD